MDGITGVRAPETSGLTGLGRTDQKQVHEHETVRPFARSLQRAGSRGDRELSARQSFVDA
jgi:hypothetical protein